MIKALWDADASAGCEGRGLLKRVAAALSSLVVPAGVAQWNRFDNDLCFVMRETGPAYMPRDDVVGSRLFRKCGYTFYTREWAQQFLREALLSHGRIKPVKARLLHNYLVAGNDFAFLLPVNVRTWLELLEDIMQSVSVRDMGARLLNDCFLREEFRFVGMDATMRVAMRQKGQATYRRPLEVRNSCVVKDDEALRRVLTVHGRTGAVLMTELVRSEGGGDIAKAFETVVKEEIRHQIEAIASDQPSVALLDALRAVCPRLQCLYLDSIHIVIVYNSTFWHKPSLGQSMLRRMQVKFQRIDADVPEGSWPWGPYYTGGEVKPFTPSEEALRAMILTGDMAAPRAASVLNAVDADVPWRRRRDYLEAMAALSSAYSGEVVLVKKVRRRVGRWTLHHCSRRDRSSTRRSDITPLRLAPRFRFPVLSLPTNM